MMKDINKARILENRRDRGRIIRSCALFHPKPITVKELKTAVSDDMYRSSELPIHLHFLESGGANDEKQPQYICRYGEKEIGTYHDDDKIHLTRFGMLLIEGSHEDENINM